jgi:hypothetical protein
MSTDYVYGDENSCTAEIILSRNGFQLTVNYLLPIPGKKPHWTEVATDLNVTVGSAVSGMQGGSKRLKMAYQHARVQQLFTILDFPQRWSYPVSLLLYLRRSILSDEFAVTANFPKDFEECPGNYFEEIVPGKEYSTALPSVQGIQQEDSDTSLLKTLSKQELQEANRMQEQKIAVWSSDDVSPASYMLGYKSSNALFNWTPYATTRLLPNGVEAGVVIHDD